MCTNLSNKENNAKYDDLRGNCPKTINPDGSYLIQKKDLMLACQGKGIKISHKRLKELSEEYPEEISLLDKYATIRKL